MMHIVWMLDSYMIYLLQLKNKEYEVALVGAFRREKDKDIVLQTLEAEIKTTLQLVRDILSDYFLFQFLLICFSYVSLSELAT